jgi:hypothetical protein
LRGSFSAPESYEPIFGPFAVRIRDALNWAQFDEFVAVHSIIW